MNIIGMTSIHYRRVFVPLWRYSLDDGTPYTDRVFGGVHLCHGYYLRWRKPPTIGQLHTHDRIVTIP